MTHMPLLLLLAFVVVPLVELWVIIQVAGWLGGPATIVVLFLDSLAGAVLVRREGRRAWSAFRSALSERRWPGDEVMQGALVLVGGALLLTPGFVTDAAGLLMVAPPSRRLLSRVVRTRLTPASLRIVGFGPSGSSGPSGGSDGDGSGRPGGSGDGGLGVEVLSVERDQPPAVEEETRDDGRDG